jgi:hypothetical protein
LGKRKGDWPSKKPNKSYRSGHDGEDFARLRAKKKKGESEFYNSDS